MLESKYGTNLESLHIPVKYQSWWWGDLKKVCSEGGGDGWFLKELKWKLGRVDKVRFWEDVWAGDTNLKTLYSRLFSLSGNQEQKVGEVGEWLGPNWRGRLRWRWVRYEWESELKANLVACISRATINRYVNDIHVWGVDKSELFTVNIA